MAATSIDELQARQTEIRGRLQELDAEYRDAQLPSDAKEEWNDLNEEFERNEATIGELIARRDRVAELSGEEGHAESERSLEKFNTRKSGVVTGEDIYDLSTIRASALNPDQIVHEQRERAARSLEMESIPNPDYDEANAKANVERLLKTKDDGGRLSRRMLTTGNRQYRRAFLKVIAGEHPSPDEQRALSLTGEKGGYAVPYQLDPTVILTSNGVVNPIRQVARVESIPGDTWKGLSSAGVSAAYSAEAAETEEASLSFAQPEVSTERASVLILASFEITQDWEGIAGEVARIIADSKDTLEASAFLTGTGENQPYGVLTGATTTVTTEEKEAFKVGDVYAVKAALPPRFRSNAAWMANDSIYDRVRQFDTQGGANLWAYIGEGRPDTLIGKPAYELSTMNAEIKENKLNLLYGDFSQYLIAERIGMGIDVVPHVMNGKKATGQRGFYAFWRNGAKVLTASAFRVSKGKGE